jgi:4-hydroxy-tetrahydrodipicolinate synthase
MGTPVRGVWCATLTPLDAAGDVDVARFAAHAHELFAAGVAGIAPFGTTGEGPSFTVAEREAALDALLEARVPSERVVAATGCAALGDAVELTRHALCAGCAGVLVLPPFFFDGVGNDAVYATYAKLIERVADDRLRLYLYHIPQLTRVPIAPAVVDRLAAAFPRIVAGVKDSSGDLANTLTLARRFPSLSIMTGHEPHIPALLAAGGAGTICGLANVDARAIRRLHDAANAGERDAALAHVRRLLEILAPYPLIPAIKAACAAARDEASWLPIREPLRALDASQYQALRGALRELGDC